MSKALEYLTTFELERLERRIWRAIRDGDGYQPFGYDWPTIRATKPEKAAALAEVLEEWRRHELEVKS